MINLKKMKAFILLIALIIFVIVCSCHAKADTYYPYASILPESDLCKNLVDTMISQSDYNSFLDWVCFYTAEDDLSLFYNISNGQAVRLRLYIVDGSHVFEKSLDYDFGYQQNNKTIVGNVEDSLGSETSTENHLSNIRSICCVFLLVVVLFFVFRSRKKSKSYMSI